MSAVVDPGAAADTRFRAGFADPVHGAQQAFRTLLDAMSAPGRVHALPAGALDGLRPADAASAPPLPAGLAAALLALVDADTPALLGGPWAAAAPWLRFHTGARAAHDGERVAMAAAPAAAVDDALLARLALGSDEAPQDGATLFVEVDALGADANVDADANATALALTGPGIRTVQPLRVAGLPDAFWRWRIALQAERPRGVDLVLAQGTRLVAIPRSSRLAIEPKEA